MLTGHAPMVAALNPLSSTSLLASLGALGVFLVMFAETGLLIGFFLPGDSLLFTAGLLCTGTASHTVHLSLPWVILAAARRRAARRADRVLHRPGGWPPAAAAHRQCLPAHRRRRAARLLDRYGQGKAIVLARFIPVVRTVVNPLAGALDVPARRSPCGRSPAAGVVGRGYAGRLRRSARPSLASTPTCCPPSP